MQNKGAIKIFAVLLALACIFYLSFTWVTRGVESDAVEFAESKVSSPKVQMVAKELAKGDASREVSYIDSLKSVIADRYLDSMKKQTVYDILLAEYTYEECKKNEINLGLDLRGGMNVTLEVSVKEIIKNLANNSPDVAFNQALDARVTARIDKCYDVAIARWSKHSVATFREHVSSKGALITLKRLRTVQAPRKVEVPQLKSWRARP